MKIKIICLALFIGLNLNLAYSEVTKIQIQSIDTIKANTEKVFFSDYLIIKGIITFKIDPNNKINSKITDLSFAPADENGFVKFDTQFELHTPVEKSINNNRLIYFVNNRGNKIGEKHFNHESKNWLYKEGYSYLWCGWNCDVIESSNKLNIHVPIAINNGKTITGNVYSEIVSHSNDIEYSIPIIWGQSIAYEPNNQDQLDAELSMRKYRSDEKIIVNRDKWGFGKYAEGEVINDKQYIYNKEGFKPAWIYELIYEAKNPKIVGLGLIAVRDIVSFFRYNETDLNPIKDKIDFCYSWGHSQSARFLNYFLFENFNYDSNFQIIFDGVIMNCPGSGKGLFNSRFAQFTRHGSHLEDNLYPIDIFPFGSTSQFDLDKKTNDHNFSEIKKSGFMPKVMYVNSATDYWTRAASLLHTTTDGTKDLNLDSNVRIYSLSGLTHTDSRIGIISRALLTALDEWVTLDNQPPNSNYPKISDGTLVPFEEALNKLPNIKGLIKPSSIYCPYKLDMGPRWEREGISDNNPPLIKGKYKCLVPQVDKDGNEISGIRLPEVELPVATFLGWSMRNSSYSETLRRNNGNVYLLPINESEKTDSRLSIQERYPSKSEFLYQVIKSLLYLKNERYILDEDFATMLQQFATLNFWQTGNDTTVYLDKVWCEPNPVKPGEDLNIYVQFKGNIKNILYVSSSFREAYDFKITLKNDGSMGDSIANDNIWSYKINIPKGVPDGSFHFDHNCVSKGLDPIQFPEDNKAIKKASITFNVKNSNEK